MTSGRAALDIRALLDRGDDRNVRHLGTTIRQLERLIQSHEHPYRQMAGQLEPVLIEQDSGIEPGQTALLLVFSLLLARCTMGQTGQQFRDDFFSDRLAVDQPILHRLLKRWHAIFDQTPEASALTNQLITELAADSLAIATDHAVTDTPAWPQLVRLFEVLMASSHGDLRRRRGVYFTPQPVVAYMIRRIDQLLRNELAESGGIHSREGNLRIVDPACGAGTFLLQIIQQARATCDDFSDNWQVGARSVLPRRLIGIDVMPACCAATRLLLEFQLRQDPVPAVTRSMIYCRNSLTDTQQASLLFAGGLPVILGNPPYANFGQLNQSDWIQKQLQTYKTGLNERKLNLSDDFIKFFRWGQHWIDRAGRGILALVTNNTYLTGLTHRRMRSSLAESFDRIEILDLNGDRRRRDRMATGNLDDNIFGVQQGIAIGIFTKTGNSSSHFGQPHVTYTQLKGSSDVKLRMLGRPGSVTFSHQPVAWEAPNFFFLPMRKNAQNTAYNKWPRMDEIFARYVSGVQTKHDALFVDFTSDAVAAKLQTFLQHAAQGRFAAGIPDWLRTKAKRVPFDADHICRYMVAPWDVRWIYYDPQLLGRPRTALLGQFDTSNVAMVFMRQTTNRGDYDNFMATNIRVSDRVFYSAHGAPFVAPLFVIRSGQREVNLSPRFLQELGSRINATVVADSEVRREPTVTAQDLFHWLMATVHSHDYRQNFDVQLRIDFPRIPWPKNLGHFRELARFGRLLSQAQLEVLQATSSRLDPPPNHAGLRPGVTIATVNWQPPDQLLINPDHQGPLKIEPAIWQFKIGGYQVLARWLKQRRQRALSADDVAAFFRLIHGIRRTIDLSQQIDRIA